MTAADRPLITCVGDTITTAEGLDALPAETVIRTAGIARRADTGRFDPPRVAVKAVTGDWSVADEDEWSVETDELDDFPATVLYVPGEPSRPSVTDNARADKVPRLSIEDGYLVARVDRCTCEPHYGAHEIHCGIVDHHQLDNLPGWPGRAETTTATDEDAALAAEEAIEEALYANDLVRSGGIDGDQYIVDGLLGDVVRALAGLLATARTRPAEGEATDLDRLYSTLNLQGVWVLIDEVAGAVCPWCGDPWESEPSCEHAEAIYQHDNRVTAFALEQAADEHFRDAVKAGIGSPSAVSAWLRERAAHLRAGGAS